MSLVNSLKIIQTSFLIAFALTGSSYLFSENLNYKLVGKEEALVKGLGQEAKKLGPGAALPYRALVSSDKANLEIVREDEKTTLILSPDSVMENLGKDKLETPQWFLYRGNLKVVNEDPILIKMGMAEALLFPGESSLELDANYLKIKSLKGGAMLSTPKQVEGVKAGQDANVNQFGKISLSGVEDKEAIGPKELESRYHLLGLKYKDVKSRRTSYFDGLSFENKKHAIASVLRLLKRHNWKDLLEKGREQIFIQDVFSLTEEDVILPDTMRKHFYATPNTDALFEDLAQADKNMDHLSAVEKDETIFFVRQKMTDPLLAHYDLKDAFKYSLRETLAHNSNVSQNPEGLTNPSGDSGMSLTSILTVDYNSREWHEGKSSAKFTIMDLSYLDNNFDNREFTKIMTSLEHSLIWAKIALSLPLNRL